MPKADQFHHWLKEHGNRIDDNRATELISCPACERNQAAICHVLRVVLKNCQQLLEIGSGSGQHASFCAPHMPWLRWQCSDLPQMLDNTAAWLVHSSAPSWQLPPPIALDVSDNLWPSLSVDALFTANTLHFIDTENVVALFKGLGQVLLPQATLCIYGPFHYGGRHNSPSNEMFDKRLKENNPKAGIRDFYDIERLAKQQDFILQADLAMPANNRMLVWQRQTSKQASPQA